MGRHSALTRPHIVSLVDTLASFLLKLSISAHPEILSTNVRNEHEWRAADNGCGVPGATDDDWPRPFGPQRSRLSEPAQAGFVAAGPSGAVLTAR
jgi:hypothetical protein